jgi:hypothetical protein
MVGKLFRRAEMFMGILDLDDVSNRRTTTIFCEIITNITVIDGLPESGFRLFLGFGENLVDHLDGGSHKIGLGFGFGFDHGGKVIS